MCVQSPPPSSDRTLKGMYQQELAKALMHSLKVMPIINKRTLERAQRRKRSLPPYIQEAVKKYGL